MALYLYVKETVDFQGKVLQSYCFGYGGTVPGFNGQFHTQIYGEFIVE